MEFGGRQFVNRGTSENPIYDLVGGGGSGSGMLLMPSYLGPTQSGTFLWINNYSSTSERLNTSEQVKFGDARSFGLLTSATISVRIWGNAQMQNGGEVNRLQPYIYMGTQPNPKTTGTQVFPSTPPWSSGTQAQTYDVTITDAFTMPAWDGGSPTRVYIYVENTGNESTGDFNIDYWIKGYNFLV